ncbi:hypothetical protein [Sphaerothrix gracilis]|uniref:hypothetical protein n=1 Tax=Sphaerothrix gracilis TaxID=3151835 RepID=UPI0031FE30BB
MNKLSEKQIPVFKAARDNWNFAEVWIDPMLSPPYILLLLGSASGSCRIHDPAKDYKIVFASASYDEAQNWLLEDEYEPIEGRLAALEL